MSEPEQLVFLGAAALTAYAGLTERHGLMRLAKPLLMPALATQVARKRKALAPRHTALLAAACGAALAGDVILVDPDAGGNLLKGAGAFAVMQTCYITVLRDLGAAPTTSTVLPRLPLLAGAGLLLHAKEGRQALPLGGYGLLLSTTGALAGDPGLGRPRDLFWGGTLFTVSDSLILARRRLATTARTKALLEGLVLATYAAAQHLLVGGMLRRLTQTPGAGPPPRR